MSESEPAAIESANQTHKGRPQVAMKRAAGGLVDILLSASIALVPFLFHLILAWLRPLEIQPTVSDDVTVVVGFCLAITPIPLIYLRIVFHKVMKAPTPGEIFSGLTAVTMSPIVEGIKQEITHAIGQFVVFASSTILGFIFVAWCVYVGQLGTMQYPGNLIMMTVFVVYSFTMMSVLYCPRSSSMYQSLIDDRCKVTIKRLRKDI